VTGPDRPQAIDELLDRAFQALNDGDRATANVLAGQVLSLDSTNADAEDLLAVPVNYGEIRRLTILFADLVDSTALSTRIEPEVYRTVVGSYRDQVLSLVNRYEGHIGSTKGDGLLAVFGHPRAHENDAQRAVQAGLEITRGVAKLDEQVKRRFGFGVAARVGVHRGLVYLDTEQDDVYGFAANLTARICGLAEPGTVAVSEAIERLVRDAYELEVRPPKAVKGVEGLVHHYRVVAERDSTALPRGPLVGRAQEIAYLESAWEQTKSGELLTPGLAFTGEAGIGKSRLATAAVDLAERSNAVVLDLMGSPFYTEVGLHPVRRLLERRSGIERAAPPAERLRLLAAEVAAHSLDPGVVLSLLAPVLGISAQTGYQRAEAEGRMLYHQIIDAVHNYLISCVGDGPALVLAEDMHWFDEDTREVVQSLLGAGSGSMLVVMTGREQASMPLSANAEVFALKPLDERETDELIGALHPEVSADARDAVRRRCDGVPLYIEEVVAKLTQQPTDALDTAQVPDSLYEALFARLRSSSNAVRVVEAAATIGSHVDRGLLVSVVELPESDVDRVLSELVAGRVLDPLGKDTWRFRHELLREVAAELSPPTLRLKLHGSIADALAAGAGGGDPDWPLIAGHYERAQRHEAAARACQKASADARDRGALGEARAYLSRAIAQITRLEPEVARNRKEISFRLQRGFLASAAEGISSANAATDFKACLQLSATDVGAEMFMTLTALYGYYAMRADLRRAQRVLESLRSAIPEGSDWLRPENTAGFGMVAWYRGEFDSARAKLEPAAAARSDIGAKEIQGWWFMPNEPIASIYTHLALARFVKGDLAGAEDELAKTHRRCEMLGFPQGSFSLAYARSMEVLMRCETSQLDQAAVVATALAEQSRQHGFDSWATVGAAQQATVSALSALAGGADAVALQPHIAAISGFVEQWRADEVKALITFYDGVIARLLLASGEPLRARDRLDIGLRFAQQSGMRFYDAELLRLRAHTFDDSEDRVAALGAALELAREQGATIFALRSAADDFEVRGQPARQALVDAVDAFPDGSSWPELARARALLG
jgi:class 3 adenylate cyclase